VGAGADANLADDEAFDPPVAAHRTARAGPGERSWSERRRAGRTLREATPRREHSAWSPVPDRVDPVEQLIRADAGRDPALVPVRIARMAASPFAYYRGAADMMALDLAGTPRSGVTAQLCGDAHCSNFGFYGSPTGLVVFDVNDFDETAMGPWEWDLKRLAVSLVLAGRGNDASDEETRVAVLAAGRAYRKVAESFRDTSVLDLWRLAVDDHSPLFHRYGRDDAVFRRGFANARRHDNAAAVAKLTEVVDGRRRFIVRPPLLTRLEPDLHRDVAAGLADYRRTALPTTARRIADHDVVDVARKVVGVGSVGTQDYVVLLDRPDGSDPLFLQLKEAVPSDVRLLLGEPTPAHEGERIVAGQRLMQAVSDPYLGWTTVRAVPFYVRQLKDLKASMPVDHLEGQTLDDYGSLCAAILSRAHARSCDPALVAGYCGRGTSLDEAIARFAVTYADQVERDHAAVVQAVQSGRLASDPRTAASPDDSLFDWPDLTLD
jgi:uncharacterized protein (DUF2252 family)